MKCLLKYIHMSRELQCDSRCLRRGYKTKWSGDICTNGEGVTDIGGNCGQVWRVHGKKRVVGDKMTWTIAVIG